MISRHHSALLEGSPVKDIEPLGKYAMAEVLIAEPAVYKEWGRTFTADTCGPLADPVEQPSRSVTQVSQDCGFSTAQYFATVFGHHFGCTPREFRERHRT